MNNVTLLSAFAGGVLAFLSPCVLPLMPGYLAFITGNSIRDLQNNRANKNVALLPAITFVVGFSTVFTLLGATATIFGSVLQNHLGLINLLGGLLVIGFGIHLLGILKFTVLYQEKRFSTRFNLAKGFGPFLFGLVFAFGWTPCIGPLLAGILILASSQHTVLQGMLLLFTFSMGLGIPFILMALAVNHFLQFFDKLKKHMHLIEIVSGVLLIVVGINMLSNVVK